MIIPHAVRQRGAYGNRVPGLIDPKALSTFTPLSVSGLSLWLDFSDLFTLFTDAGVTNVSTDGDAIYQANDKSGNGYHVSQSNIGSRPLYKTGANGINWRSIGQFDGSNDYLSRSVSNWLSGNSEGCVFIVSQVASHSASYAALSSADEGGTSYLISFAPYHYLYDQIFFYKRNGSSINQFTSNNSEPQIDTPYLQIFASDNSSYYYGENGQFGSVQLLSGDNNGDWFNSVPNRDNLAIGALIRSSISDYFYGKIAEMLF